MAEHLILLVALVGVLGVGAQWLAWRLHLPAIVLMALAGLLAGPVTGLVDPAQDFGQLWRPMIALAVAIILFEGGLSLDFRELRGVAPAVWRLVWLGAPLAWGLGSLAAVWIAGLSWPTAVLFGGVLVVTGPTVIMPLLRQSRLSPRPAAVLKWEGIINDPLGALLAVLVFEYIRLAQGGEAAPVVILRFAFGALAAAAIGIGAGRGIAAVFGRGMVPEFLKPPVLLVAVLSTFAASEAIAHETGLVAVTALGITVANARVASIEELRQFKETITIILVSGLFVLLTATLRVDQLAALDTRDLLFVAALLFVVRPWSTWLATIGSGLERNERLLVAWIAPRGIVAVAVTGFFGPALVELGYADGARLVPLSFAIVFATVVAHGFTIGWLARRLGLSWSGKRGALLVGGSRFSAALGRALRELDYPVVVADRVWHHLHPARQAGVPVYHGELLSEATEHRLDLGPYASLLALTDNDAYNTLVCSEFAHEFGRTGVYQLSVAEDDRDDPHALPHTLRGRTFLRSGATFDELEQRMMQGWVFQRTKITDSYGLDQYLADRPEGGELVAVARANGSLVFATPEGRPQVKPGDIVLGFAPPGESRAARRRRESRDAAAAGG